MPFALPLVASIPNYRFSTTIDNITYLIDARWNTRDNAWYLDFLEDDETPIVNGVKIVLGMYLGRWVNHILFNTGVFVATDTSGKGREATLDDLGTRVVVQRYSAAEVVLFQFSS